jgi:hypothetical protein
MYVVYLLYLLFSYNYIIYYIHVEIHVLLWDVLYNQNIEDRRLESCLRGESIPSP